MPPGFIPNPSFPRSETAAHAIAPTGAKVVEAAEGLAARRTGHLAGAIAGGVVQLEDGRFVYRVFDSDFKARFIEFGTIYMAAEPFLGPAALEVVGNLH